MSARLPVYGGACGYRWPSEDGKDVHGCGKPPGKHRLHKCTCNEWRHESQDDDGTATA